MKSKKLTTLLAVLLVAVALIGTGRRSVVAQSPSETPVAGTAFDIKPVLEKYIADLPDNFYGIKPEDALRALSGDPKPFLIDLREPKEFGEGGFIAGAVNIPLRSLTQSLDRLPALDKPIMVYCGVGHRGSMALMTLRLLGYTDVKSIFGGFNAWKAASLPVAKGVPGVPTNSGEADEVDPDLFAVLDKYITSLPDDFYAVSPTALMKSLMSEQKPFVLDVRETKELSDNGFIRDSVSVPLRTLFKSLDTLPKDKSAEIVTYCAIGHRGGMAMMTLHLLGYTNVKSMGGGFNAWVKGGLPVAKS
jgi:rhodanese-related sulfurtransferase